MILQRIRSLPFIPVFGFVPAFGLIPVFGFVPAFGRISSVPVFQGAAMTGAGGPVLPVSRKGLDPFDILRDRGYNLGGRTR